MFSSVAMRTMRRASWTRSIQLVAKRSRPHQPGMIYRIIIMIMVMMKMMRMMMVKMLGYVVSCVLLLLVEKLVFGIFIRIIIYSFLCAYLMSIICFVEFALVCVSKYAFCNSLHKIQFFFFLLLAVFLKFCIQQWDQAFKKFFHSCRFKSIWRRIKMIVNFILG